MTDTPNIGLPFIDAAQAQKHVTHNDALRILDALTMPSVLDRDLSAPPASPAEGDRYIVKPAGAGAFAGHDNAIAYFRDGAWSFLAPRTGWLCHVGDESLFVVWTGSAWQLVNSELQNVGLLGIGASADATNPFSAKLNNALWTAKTVGEGGTGDLRYKLNKEAAAKTLSLLMQTAYSGRAEIGLTGDDDLHLKVSSDGSSWHDAIIIDRISGAATLLDVLASQKVQLSGHLTPAQITANQNDYNPSGLTTASVLRVSSDTARTITGLAGGAMGRVIALINVGSNPITLSNTNAASSAANRFQFGADITIAANRSAVIWYDTTDSRWRLLSAT